MAAADLTAQVGAVLAEKNGELWQTNMQDLRVEVERRLCLQEGALLERRYELLIAVTRAWGIRVSAPAGGACAAAPYIQALCSGSCSMAAAQASLEKLEVVLADANAAKAALAPEMSLVALMCVLMLSDEPKLPALALRVLTAVSMHGGGCTTLLLQADGLRNGTGLLDVLLGRLPRCGDELSILIVALINNLADTPANQLRIVASGALGALTHVILNPAASGVLKEHVLTAAAAMGAMAEEEISFPQVVGRLCASRVPGTQRQAVHAMEILADRPQLRPQLAALSDIVSGLRSACGSRDSVAAQGAKDTLGILGITS